MYIVICGGGKIAEYLALQMLGKGHNVALIEKRREIADHLAEVLPGRQLVICGDGCDSSFQSDAGITRADVFVATTGHDDDNLVSCEIATTVFHVPRTIARVNNPKNLRIFREMGIEPVSSTSVISRIIEEEAFAGNMQTVSTLRRNNLDILELELPKTSKTRLGGRRAVRDYVLPAGSLIVAVSHGNDFEPALPDSVLTPGDSVIVLVKTGDQNLVRKALGLKPELDE